MIFTLLGGTRAAPDGRHGNRRSGFGLIELMFSMALLITVMVAAFLFLDHLMSRFQMARDHYVATTICQGRIERARAAPYSDLPLLAEEEQLVDDFGNSASPNGRFRRTTVVLADDPEPGLTTMRVRTDICSCSRLGWRTMFHPIRSGPHICHFGDDNEKMSFLFTDLESE